MRRFKIKTTLALALAFMNLSTSVLAKPASSFADIKITPKVSTADGTTGELRADAKELADLLKITPYVEQLSASRRAGTSNTKQMMRMRMLCLWRIFIAGQEVRKRVAYIDRDLATSYVALDSLTSKRNMVNNLATSANFIQGGVLGVCKQSLFLAKDFHASQYPLVVGASTGTGISLLTLLVPSLWHRRIDAPPNSLAHFLNPKFSPDDADRSYLWHFLNSPIPGEFGNMTRRQVLVKHWETFSILNENKPLVLKKLSALPEGSENLSESINLISQRINLLFDLKTHIEEFDGALFELHQAIACE